MTAGMTALSVLYRLDHQALVAWLFKEYGLGKDSNFQNPHRIRRQNIADRLELYRDQGRRVLGKAIDQVYTTDEMKQTLRAYIPVSLEQNVSRRIVNEIASLYDRPALRKMADRDEAFHVEEKRLGLAFVHQEAHRLTNLCNETLIWQFAGIDGKPTLRIVTPNIFDALPDPRDQLKPAGYILDAKPIGPWVGTQDTRPCYEIWDDTFHYLVNAQGQIVDESGAVGKPREHGLKRIPGVLLHRREPTTCILDDSYGEDIKSGHIGVSLLEVMIMRLSKVQGENQPILQGNLAALATGQVANGEKPLALPPDVVASMLNMKTDPDHYLKVQEKKIANLEKTYGLGYDDGAGGSDSGFSYQVRREKLTELRIEQRARAVVHEGQVAELIGFSSDGMRVDFQEQAIPIDAKDEVALLDDKMRKGLDSPIAYLMRKDPDLSREEATKLILANLGDFSMLIAAVRALNIPSGADAADPGQTPQQNGAMGGRPPSDGGDGGDSAQVAA